MVSGVRTNSDLDWEAGRASRGVVGRPSGWEKIDGTVYGSNSEEDNQAFGLSVLVADEGVGVDGCVFELRTIDLCGVDLGFLRKGTSVWGMSGSTTTRMAEVNIKML
jgi:hypothetical protein